jgi:HD-GYP domain-containing protein (c-di-GMP phosphodiesterase class II)
MSFPKAVGIMKSVSVSSISAGTSAPADYYSEKGELLVSRGVTISQNHLDTFKRRNIFEVFVRPTTVEEEISHLLTKEFKALDEVDIDDHLAPQKIPAKIQKSTAQESLLKLLQSERAQELDKQLGKTPDRPVGPALKNKATQISVQERTEDYKTGIASSYDYALSEVKEVLDSLAAGGKTDGRMIKSIVQRFERIFVTDRNILLNLSGIKHTGEDYIYHHSLNVCLLAINIAASSGYNENQVVEIGMGALLHDIGMFLIPKEIRTKQGRLSEEEWFEIQKHPILGLHLLEKISRLPEAIPYVAYQVHERENSRGYPKQRNSLLIHRFAKLAQIADIYEAMTSPRSYRKAYIPHEGVVRILKMSKTGLIPGEFVKAFLEYVSLYPVGSLVELNDHRIAKVIHANKDSLGKPLVSIITDTTGRVLAKGHIVQEDLLKNKNIQIIKALPSDYLKDTNIMMGF